MVPRRATTSPSWTAKSTVTSWDEGLESASANVCVWLPESPSADDASDTVTAGSGSSFAIVTVAVSGVPSGAPVAPVSLTENVSSGSWTPSPFNWSGMFAVSEPAGIVTDVPLEA